ncbi:hypothetical protein CL619_04780 [archaeon]|nr:hypothetical protein [archaeon]
MIIEKIGAVQKVTICYISTAAHRGAFFRLQTEKLIALCRSTNINILFGYFLDSAKKHQNLYTEKNYYSSNEK